MVRYQNAAILKRNLKKVLGEVLTEPSPQTPPPIFTTQKWMNKPVEHQKNLSTPQQIFLVAPMDREGSVGRPILQKRPTRGGSVSRKLTPEASPSVGPTFIKLIWWNEEFVGDDQMLSRFVDVSISSGIIAKTIGGSLANDGGDCLLLYGSTTGQNTGSTNKLRGCSHSF